MRLIDADELRKELLMIDCMEDAVEIVDNQPTFDLEEIKADGRKEAIDEFYDELANELTWILNTDAIFLATRLDIYSMIGESASVIREKLKEKKECTQVKEK